MHELLIKVKDIDRKHPKAAAKQKVDLKSDKLFDICLFVYAGKFCHAMTKGSTVMLNTPKKNKVLVLEPIL